VLPAEVVDSIIPSTVPGGTTKRLLSNKNSMLKIEFSENIQFLNNFISVQVTDLSTALASGTNPFFLKIESKYITSRESQPVTTQGQLSFTPAGLNADQPVNTPSTSLLQSGHYYEMVFSASTAIRTLVNSSIGISTAYVLHFGISPANETESLISVQLSPTNQSTFTGLLLNKLTIKTLPGADNRVYKLGLSPTISILDVTRVVTHQTISVTSAMCFES